MLPGARSGKWAAASWWEEILRGAEHLSWEALPHPLHVGAPHASVRNVQPIKLPGLQSKSWLRLSRKRLISESRNSLTNTGPSRCIVGRRHKQISSLQAETHPQSAESGQRLPVHACKGGNYNELPRYHCHLSPQTAWLQSQWVSMGTVKALPKLTPCKNSGVETPSVQFPYLRSCLSIYPLPHSQAPLLSYGSNGLDRAVHFSICFL